MLVLTRKLGETIMINDNITVTVLGLTGHQVKLGINAPREVSINREEIYALITRDAKNGSNSDKMENV